MPKKAVTKGSAEPLNEAKLQELTLDAREDSVMDDFSDIVFCVEDRDIKAIKSVLCIASPVFRAMFGPNFKENGENRIPLPGKKFAIFNEFLECFNPNILRPVTVHNVYQLLPLVEEYQVESLKPYCEKILLGQINHTSEGLEIYRHLRIAEMFGLQGGIKEKCCYLASEMSVAVMKTCGQKFPVSKDSKLKIQELALMRYDLMKEDESFLIGKTRLKKPCISVQEALKYENYSMARYANKEHLRMLRLCYRYMEDDKDMKEYAIQRIRSKRANFNADDTQIYELLPGKVKHDI